MADALFELLAPSVGKDSADSTSTTPSSPTATNYLSYLTTLSLQALSDTEPQSLAQSAHSNLLSLQALSSRSHRSVIAASDALSTLGGHLPALTASAFKLRNGVPELDDRALAFSQKYSKLSTENTVLDRRKQAVLLSRNVDRIADILELPTLLTTAIASAAASSPASSTSSAPSSANYSPALDLFAHIKRVQMTHPESAMIRGVLAEAEEAMKEMTSSLVSSLRGQNIRLAAAIRTIGWLRRVCPELATPGLPLTSTKPAQGTTHPSTSTSTQPSSEGSFGYLFLICRLYNLLHMLEALAPLRDLADQETQHRLQQREHEEEEEEEEPTRLLSARPAADTLKKKPPYAHSPFTGQQTERYLKRYIEIFREQSFATVSMYKNIFPSTASTGSNTPSALTADAPKNTDQTPVISLTPPTPLAPFPAHLISLLTETLHTYLPNLTDHSARDSLLMQVLYAAGSLGRLGADYSLVIAALFEEDEEREEKAEEAEVEVEADGAKVASETGDREEGRQVGEDGKMGAKKEEKQHFKIRKKNEDDDRDDADNEPPIPEWIRIMKKHREQSSRLEALSSAAAPAVAGSQQEMRRPVLRKGSSSQDAVVK